MSRYAFAAAVLFFTAVAPIAGAGEDTPSPTAELDGMSCEQLAKESQRIETAQAEREKRRDTGRKLKGFATSLLSAAGPQLANRAGIRDGGLIGSAVASAAQSSMIQGMMSNGTVAEPPMSEEVRLENIRDLMRQKQC